MGLSINAMEFLTLEALLPIQIMKNYTITICSDSGEDTAIQLDFTFFDTQANADILTIYDGPDTDGALIGSYSGTNSPGVVQSTNTSGCLTISFQSNNAITREGFEAIISCATPCQEIDLSIVTNPVPGIGGFRNNRSRKFN